jgi:hypothetical protein
MSVSLLIAFGCLLRVILNADRSTNAAAFWYLLTGKDLAQSLQHVSNHLVQQAFL